MLSYRLRWYALQTGRLLRRHWQALVLAVALLLPAMPVFAQSQLLGAPVLAAIAPSQGIEAHLLWMMLLEGVGILWALGQARAINGGPFARYLLSLPRAPWRSCLVDTIVLVLADTPLLLPAGAAAIALAYVPDKTSHYAALLALVLLVIAAQRAALSRNVGAMSRLLVANACLIIGLHGNATLCLILSAGCVALCLTAVAAGSLHGASACSTGRAYPRPRNRFGALRYLDSRVARAIVARVDQALPPLMHLELRILVDAAGPRTLARCLVMATLGVAAVLLAHLWQFDTRALPAALIAQGLIGWVAAGAFRDFDAAHDRAASFFKALPIGARTLTIRDNVATSLMALPFSAVAPLALSLHGGLAASKGVAIVLAGIALIGLLRLPMRHLARQSMVGCALLVALWTALMFQWVV